MAKLHSYDPREIGLNDYAKVSKNYYERQIKTWTTQYKASETEKIKSMDYLIDWLPKTVPTDKEQYQKTTIVHGDFRLDNVVFHKTEMRIIAVLDWELSTLGNPFSDLASVGLIYHLPPTGYLPGLGNFDKGMSGIPTEIKLRDTYLERMDGLSEISEEAWSFFLTYGLFKGAAIA